MLPLSLAFSPCPNDTFLFHAWTHGLIPQTIPIQIWLADIQQLNEWIIQAKFQISKASISCIGKTLNDYIMLPVGATLGYGCGPKIIAAKPFPLKDLSKKIIAIPGADTTAQLLMEILLDPPKQKIYRPYHQIVNLIQEGTVDAGLIIHETRFTFEKEGLCEIADLGRLWEMQYHLPIPLGGIIAKRCLGNSMLKTICQHIQHSVVYARNNPDRSCDYVLTHSQEKDSHIVKQHIDLYVTPETYQLSAKGISSIETLLQLARERRLIPNNNLPWLLE